MKRLSKIQTDYDSLGRQTSQTDTVTGITHSWTYPLNSRPIRHPQETFAVGSGQTQTSTALTRNARDLESSRLTTIASGNTITHAINARDSADRWLKA